MTFLLRVPLRARRVAIHKSGKRIASEDLGLIARSTTTLKFRFGFRLHVAVIFCGLTTYDTWIISSLLFRRGIEQENRILMDGRIEPLPADSQDG